MQFHLIDRITALEPGKRIEAVKALSMGEEYLRDHFPRFPVMPGVLMLEAMYQASAWLVHVTTDFRCSAVVLKEARNVKYAEFVEPGQTLELTSEVLKQEGNLTTFKASGSVQGRQSVSARLVLDHYNWSDRRPERRVCDAYAHSWYRRHFEDLYGTRLLASGEAAASREAAAT